MYPDSIRCLLADRRVFMRRMLWQWAKEMLEVMLRPKFLFYRYNDRTLENKVAQRNKGRFGYFGIICQTAISIVETQCYFFCKKMVTAFNCSDYAPHAVINILYDYQ